MKTMTLLRRAQFHGANRLAEPRHRVYWTIAIFLLLWLALSILGEMIKRFLNTPTHLIKLDTNSAEMPFPSVLVCPEISFPQEKIDKLLEISVYWTIAILLLLWLALSILGEMIKRFLNTPTHLIKLDTNSAEMPFPSVLVCPEVSFPQEKIDKLLEISKYPEGMNENYIRPLIRQLAAFFSPDVPYSLLELSDVLQFLEYNGLDVESTGALLTTSCEETFIRCRFQGSNIDCAQIFHMELTLYGFCCVFNGRSLKRELKLNVRQNNKYNEWHTTEVGPFAALMMAINQTQVSNNVDLAYKWLIVQSGQRYVETSKNGTPLSPGTEEWASFWTSHLFVAEDSRFLGDRIRGCQIDNNRPLTYFQVYSRKYCLVECQMWLTMERCQCLLPAHHRPHGIPICHAFSLPCARRAQVADSGVCDCPFTCEYQSELTETTTYKFSTTFTSYDDFYDDLDLNQVTVVRVFIKSHEAYSFVRRSYFNFYDLFAQLGGVFNVFFGCSILTLLELLQLARYSCRRGPRTQATTGNILKPVAKKSTASSSSGVRVGRGGATAQGAGLKVAPEAYTF
ncbi:hypothetical protein MSG28_001329 [Choristoneura fumiferana]|uniref:Uncharacterized protein n=1 Tax=Choristoneura fumiferana TaxID=7141 RepID=A0ACC0KUA4_CHOFU|nr:hypothetical protein MSG28_001329 [Choristoneura fumiferana]